MTKWLSTLFSELHLEYLKPQGFKKVRQTFSRDHRAYHERFNFQASSWNFGDDWTFYLNVGIEFHDLEPEPYWCFLPHTHWGHRVEYLVPGAPRGWDGNSATPRELLKEQLGELVLQASEALSRLGINSELNTLERRARIDERSGQSGNDDRARVDGQ